MVVGSKGREMDEEGIRKEREMDEKGAGNG
jgi:hypothetical protein